MNTLTINECTIFQIIQSIKKNETSLENLKDSIDTKTFEELQKVFSDNIAFTSWHL